MRPFVPVRVYYEEVVKKYEQGKDILDRYEKILNLRDKKGYKNNTQ